MKHPHDIETGSVTDSASSDSDDAGAAGDAPAGREEDWDDWQGGADDADEDATQSLFGPEVLPSPEAAMRHDADKHGFDLRRFAVQARLDEYGIIRLINYIRTEVAAGRDPRPVLQQHAQPPSASGSDDAAAHAAPWASDAFLLPVLPDDGLLCYDYEEWAEEAAAAAAREAGAAAAGPSGAGAAGASGQAAAPSVSAAAAAAAAAAEAAGLRAENAALRAALAAMRLEFLPEELREGDAEGPLADGEGPSSSAAAAAASPASPAAAAAAAAASRVDAAYFDSYSFFDIHRDMLGDRPRTEAYRDALERNPALLSGATVLDVGCGTGILSLFAARAGAARVVAVDGSERIAGFARRHAELAGYADACGGPMTVVTGKVEDLIAADAVPLQKGSADVLVSEWMGYALLFEAMLGSVLAARDAYLRPGGAVLPDLASVHVAGAASAAGGLSFWDDVYGFRMTPVAEAVAEAGRGQAVVMPVAPHHITTTTAAVKTFDLCAMSADEQDFTADFVLEPLPLPTATATATSAADAAAATTTQQQTQQQQQPAAAAEVGCIVLWFDTAFSARHCGQHPVLLSTSPFAPPTHWAQTLLTLRTPVPLLRPGAGGAAAEGGVGATRIEGRLSMVRSPGRHRSLDIGITYHAVLSDGRVIEEAQLHHMNVMAPA